MSSLKDLKTHRKILSIRGVAIALLVGSIVMISTSSDTVTAGCRGKSHLSIYPDIVSSVHAQFFDHGIVSFSFSLNPAHAGLGSPGCGGDDGFIFEGDSYGTACDPVAGTYSTTVTYCDPLTGNFGFDPQFQLRFEEDQTTPKKKNFGLNFGSSGLGTYYNVHVGADGIYFVTAVEYQGVSVDVTSMLE